MRRNYSPLSQAVHPKVKVPHLDRLPKRRLVREIAWRHGVFKQEEKNGAAYDARHLGNSAGREARQMAATSGGDAEPTAFGAAQKSTRAMFSFENGLYGC
tara:strand:+ start:89 stop:388 length:300 start_codon:yes stop_codon:yes gene_type:complete